MSSLIVEYIRVKKSLIQFLCMCMLIAVSGCMYLEVNDCLLACSPRVETKIKLHTTLATAQTE